LHDDVPAHRAGPESATCNAVNDVSGQAKVVQAHRIENMAWHTHITSQDRSWSPPQAPAAPPRYNHDLPLAQLWDGVWHNRERTTLAVVEGDRPRLGGSTVCRAALRRYNDSHEQRFPGGYYSVDLRQDDRATAINSVLRRLGLTDAEIPTDPSARERRLREELGSRGALAVLVDNADRFEDVLPFLSEAPGSLTLVSTNATSSRLDEREAWVRERLSMVEELPVWVPPMTTDERIGVLALHAGISELDTNLRDMAQAIVEKLGHDLGAVKEVGRRIRYRRARGEDGLRTEYAAIDRGGDAVADADGSDGLTARQRMRIAELACHPETDFGAGVAAALWGCAVDEARTLLDDLAERGLVEGANGSGQEPRYRFAPTRQAERVRDSQGLSVDVNTAYSAILRYYRDLTRAVHASLSPHRWLFGQPSPVESVLTRNEARELALTERNTLRAVIFDAVRQGQYLLAFELCEAFWSYWFPQGCFSEVVDTHTAVLEAASLDPARHSRLLVQRSIAYRRDREFTFSEADAVRALDLARSAEPLHDLALLTALEARGDCYREHTTTGNESEADLRAAEEHFSEALRVAEGLSPEDVRAVANAMRKVAEVRDRRGSRTESRFLLERVDELWRTRLPGDLHNLARTLTARGDLEFRAGDQDQALVLWSEALELHERTGDRRRVADLRVRRADVFEYSDQAACLEELREALGLYEVTGALPQAATVREMIEALENRT
jgi:tetratricopeptide (TPR) repeat protein